tara:strand:- start:1930 stop:2280 length:351 start_codon:yes stop_codon:yes gene_type:complete
MNHIRSNHIIEEQTFVNKGKKIVLKMEYGEGYVIIDDKTFNPSALNNEELIISDYEWHDYAFEDNDGVVFESNDESLVEELEEIFDESQYEGLENAGWTEEDTVVTFIGYEIETVD